MTTVIRTVLLAIVVNAAVTARAVQFGWQVLPDGGIEYLVQVEPQLLDSFHKDGYASSDLPPNLRDIRRIRITVGEEKLPNQNNLQGPLPLPPPPDAVQENQKSGDKLGGGAGATNPQESATTVTATNPASQETQTGALTDWNQSPENRGGGDTASTKSSPAAEQTLPPIPFLHSSMGRHAAENNPSALNQTAKVDDPRLGSNEGPQDGGAAAENYGANKPPLGSSSSQNGGSTEATTPKPWWALMAALLALFGSLGANVYLVWIHQAVRAKYRSLLQRSPLGGAAA